MTPVTAEGLTEIVRLVIWNLPENEQMPVTVAGVDVIIVPLSFTDREPDSEGAALDETPFTV
jgi:hypothetical protein